MTAEKDPGRELRRSSRDINRTRRKFSKVMRRLPQAQQDLVSDMTSVLLESDVRTELALDPSRIEEISENLRASGIDDKKLKTIMDYLNLPFNTKK